jgi:putative membrane protein
MFPFDGGISIWFLMVALINIAFVVGVIVLIMLGVRWLMRQNARDRYQGETKGEDTALELLRQRFARGEIDAEEFEQRRRTLGG